MNALRSNSTMRAFLSAGRWRAGYAPSTIVNAEPTWLDSRAIAESARPSGHLARSRRRLLRDRRDLAHRLDDLVGRRLLLLGGGRDLLGRDRGLLDHLEDLLERVAGDVRELDTAPGPA